MVRLVCSITKGRCFGEKGLVIQHWWQLPALLHHLQFINSGW